MFQRRVAQQVTKNVVSTQTRKMGGGPQGWHVLGTKQADYIQTHNIVGELPATPGYSKTMPWQLWGMWVGLGSSILAYKVLYNVSKPVRVDIQKVTVEHPDTQEPVYLFKPVGIHKDQHDLFSFNLVQAPQLEYTRRESIMAAKLALYNDEMDFWLKHGKDSEKVLGRPLALFKPEISFVTDQQDPETFKPIV